MQVKSNFSPVKLLQVLGLRLVLEKRIDFPFGVWSKVPSWCSHYSPLLQEVLCFALSGNWITPLVLLVGLNWGFLDQKYCHGSAICPALCGIAGFWDACKPQWRWEHHIARQRLYGCMMMGLCPWACRQRGQCREMHLVSGYNEWWWLRLHGKLTAAVGVEPPRWCMYGPDSLPGFLWWLV